MDADLAVRRPLDAIRDDQLPDVFRTINAFLHPLDLDAAERLGDRIRKNAWSAAAAAIAVGPSLHDADEDEPSGRDALVADETGPTVSGTSAGSCG
jgi:hypothetical protein